MFDALVNILLCRCSILQSAAGNFCPAAICYACDCFHWALSKYLRVYSHFLRATWACRLFSGFYIILLQLREQAVAFRFHNIGILLGI